MQTVLPVVTSPPGHPAAEPTSTPGVGEAVLRSHRPAVEAVCVRRLRRPADVSAATEEVMRRASAGLIATPGPRLAAQLRRVAERVCLDMVREGAAAILVGAPTGRRDLDEGGGGRRRDLDEAVLVRRALAALRAREADDTSQTIDADPLDDTNPPDDSKRRLTVAGRARTPSVRMALIPLAAALAVAVLLPGAIRSELPPTPDPDRAPQVNGLLQPQDAGSNGIAAGVIGATIPAAPSTTSGSAAGAVSTDTAPSSGDGVGGPAGAGPVSAAENAAPQDGRGQNADPDPVDDTTDPADPADEATDGEPTDDTTTDDKTTDGPLDPSPGLPLPDSDVPTSDLPDIGLPGGP